MISRSFIFVAVLSLVATVALIHTQWKPFSADVPSINLQKIIVTTVNSDAVEAPSVQHRISLHRRADGDGIGDDDGEASESVSQSSIVVSASRAVFSAGGGHSSASSSAASDEDFFFSSSPSHTSTSTSTSSTSSHTTTTSSSLEDFFSESSDVSDTPSAQASSQFASSIAVSTADSTSEADSTRAEPSSTPTTSSSKTDTETSSDTTSGTTSKTTFESVDNGSTVIVTQTSIVQSEPSAASDNSNKSSDSSSSGLSHTNKIVVGVVVGVGGFILIGLMVVFFVIKRRNGKTSENGSWTFWRKNAKEDKDEFLNGELGVRDRNINQGSNF
ncbi:hypothetical protein PSN45_005013 [Yamadazyma tenuis]|uniref:uncharacterized protein n=1 Tax=Candida tenuis TaxID=2315449 RepID=UPI0027987E61|nr:hypothetical protein PSN45_005013 [Yamadazyma tenuis]